jgi:hypothetical protein
VNKLFDTQTAIVRPADDLAELARRVGDREKRNRRGQLDHVKQQAADVYAARQQAKRGQWGPWCEAAALIQSQAWRYAEFGKVCVTHGFSSLPDDEQWAAWQKIQGNTPRDEEQSDTSEDSEPDGHDEETFDPSPGTGEASGDGRDEEEGVSNEDTVGSAESSEGESEEESEGPGDPKADAAAAYCSKLNAIARDTDALFRSVQEAGKSPLGYAVHWNSIQQQIKAARQSIAVGRPKYRCPYCTGTGDDDGNACKPCKETGWVCKATHHNAPEYLKGGQDAEGDE